MEFHIQRRSRSSRSVWLTILLILAIVLGGALIVESVLSFTTPLEVTLQGSDVLTLEFGEDYQAPELQVTYLGKEVDAVITVDQPRMDQVGSYTVVYTAEWKNRTGAAYHKVEIVDTTAPVITLTYDAEGFTEPGSEYVEEGFAAYDEVDGDLTAAVQRTEENGTVIYTVSDAAGNSTRVERSIVYDDRTAPELVLIGDETVHITAGTKFDEPGYTATDNVDGDITVNVIVNGEVNIGVPGSYTIHYSVTDSYGNSAEADRDVVVAPTEPPETEPPETTTPETQPKPTEKPDKDDEEDYSNLNLRNDPENPGEKVVYLTFDDGPSDYTLELLEVLEKYNVKATFFVVGSAKMEYLDDIAQAGHSIALHSNTHNYGKIYKSKNAFYEDLYALQEKVYEYCGVKTFLHRFPGGSSNSVSKKYCKGIMTQLTQELGEKGFTYFDWNVDSDDAGSARTAKEVYENVIAGIKNRKTSVVLQHDIKGYSVDAVEKIIQWGLAHGYTFLPLTEDSPTCHHSVNN